MIRSMTGFATRTGAAGGLSWAFDLRGVNGRGFDLRLRLPDGVPGLEAMVREVLGKGIARGSVTLSLRLTRDEGAGELALDEAQLARVLGALKRIEEAGLERDVGLSAPSAAEVLAVRGVIATSAGTDLPDESIVKHLRPEVDALLTDFNAMRDAEGAHLRQVILAQLARIEALTAEAAVAAEARRDETRAAMTAALRRIVEDVSDVSEDRLAQELAMIAVKQDVTEELDRLAAHVAAARALLAEAGPVGRKLDFLAQEFNREANTLCSKAQNAALTTIGLDLKAAVDQMREQIQNVE